MLYINFPNADPPYTQEEKLAACLLDKLRSLPPTKYLQYKSSSLEDSLKPLWLGDSYEEHLVHADGYGICTLCNTFWDDSMLDATFLSQCAECNVKRTEIWPLLSGHRGWYMYYLHASRRVKELFWQIARAEIQYVET